MAPEQNINKPVDNLYKVEVFSLGIVLFRLLFKAFPFSPESMHEEARNPAFLESFMNSEKNIHKVRPSPQCLALLKRMLAYDQSDRCTIEEVLNSEWFHLCEWRLKTHEVLERAKQSLFSKLKYVVNLTHVKLPVKELREKSDKERFEQELARKILEEEKKE
jgi:serine/threonine protein kinase